MNPPGAKPGQGGEGAGLQQLWRQVCASRGTLAPDAAHLAGFIEGLDPPERNKLQSILALAARGREQPGDLSLVSWAASCTRPALLAQLAARGLVFTGAHLFACGLALRQEGWDMQARLAQLASRPEDVDALRALLPAAGPIEPDQAQAQAAPERPDETAVDDAAADEAFYPWPEDDHDDGAPGAQALGWQGEPMDGASAALGFNAPAALPMLPTRFAREQPLAFEAFSNAPKDEPLPGKARLRLRLFGASAAHTLEVTAHRRGGDFLGVQVLSIDSAHAFGSGEGYDWARKLVIQLTPEEMPGLIATLMGIKSSVRFGHHGARRDKFLEVRRQEGGLVIVTGEQATVYSVPVSTASVYYVLDLCCRAMSTGMGSSTEVDAPWRSVSDVLMLVRNAHGF
ncbi:MAG: hypothetical protein H7346_06430 [Burkholderiaceae bacterium]|nr:hypothetical protein [Burkholderiaceae bacterium]